MPIDSHYTRRFHLIDGIASWPEAFGDPASMGRFEQFMAQGRTDYVPPAVESEAVEAPGPHGPVPMRVYSSGGVAPGTPRAGLVWLHGGGFVAGDLEMPEADAVARELVVRAGAVVVSVDYRLVDPATGANAFPVPLDDVLAAWRWVVVHADALGLDARRVAIGGASAGANLATGAAMRLRDDGDEVRPCRLLLAYPCLHAVLPPQPVAHEGAMSDVPELLRFRPADVERITRDYAGGDIASVSPYAMPAAGDPAGLPPVTMVNSEYDDLRVSGEDFARMLAEAGVQCDVSTEPGVLHGHLNESPRVAGTERTLARFAAALSSQLDPGSAGRHV